MVDGLFWLAWWAAFRSSSAVRRRPRRASTPLPRVTSCRSAALAAGASVTFPTFVSAEVKDGYQFALERPDVLRVLPCYCGCGLTSGHKSNLDCFVLGQDKSGKVAFDEHASFCQTCLDIARDAKRLAAEGKSLPEIRAYVDQAYRQKGPSTDTPKPTALAAATDLGG